MQIGMALEFFHDDTSQQVSGSTWPPAELRCAASGVSFLECP